MQASTGLDDSATGMTDDAGTADASTSVDADSTTTDDPDTGSSSGGEPITNCDIFAQDCPDDFKCVPFGEEGGGTWDSTICSPIDPDPAGVGEACQMQDSAISGIDNCDIGAMCFNVDAKTLQGECVALCGGSPARPTCDDDCAECQQSGSGSLALCLSGCDPLSLSCDVGEGCYPVGLAFACLPDVSRAGGGVGSACEFTNQCDSGLMCAPAAAWPDCDGTGCCVEYCDVSDAAACAGAPRGVACQPFYPDGPPNIGCVDLADVGICGLPVD